MASWKKLNLGSTFARPPINTLAALRLDPKSTLYAAVRHDIGCLQPDPAPDASSGGTGPGAARTSAG